MPPSPSSLGSAPQRSPATWIWFPGDFELWLSNMVQARRTERDVFIPPFWRMEAHHPVVNFVREVELSSPEQVRLRVEGRYNVAIDGTYVSPCDGCFEMPAGRHQLMVTVWNPQAAPALWLDAPGFVSDGSWFASLSRKPLQMETTRADSGGFDDPDEPPSAFHLPRHPKAPASTSLHEGVMLVDFGRESFGYPVLQALSGSGSLRLVYGESKEEALDSGNAETWDDVLVEATSPEERTLPVARAFRFISCRIPDGVRCQGVTMQEETRGQVALGRFSCNDEKLNRIWQVARHTLELNTREFFLDGIKRDRWIWSGDAVQSFLMDYYLSADARTCKRTLWALCGKEPLEHHINTIIDYSLYWLISLETHHLYSGDTVFLERIYPRARLLTEFCLGRRNVSGYLEELPGDWLFLDWAEMPKQGELCAIQVLLWRALKAVGHIAQLVGHAPDALRYGGEAERLRTAIRSDFWDPVRGVFVHHRLGGVRQELVTGYANMFALLHGLAETSERETIRRNGLLDPGIQRITTPYMSFYRLESLCGGGDLAEVTAEILSYWGGMLDRGATSFWEAFDDRESGVAQYAMYGRPYGKSLCHAWGASPLYLLGRFYLGVTPTEPGFCRYLIEPRLGGLQWIDGSVPSPRGLIQVRLDHSSLRVTCHAGAVLRLHSKVRPSASGPAHCQVVQGPGHFDLLVSQDGTYHIEF